MKTKLVNALSLNFFAGELDTNHGIMLSVIKIGAQQAQHELRDGFESFVGHTDLARLLSEMLGIDVPVHRGNYEFHPGDVILVSQYTGPRLPEGSTVLPEGARIEFFRVVPVCGIKTLS